MMEAAGDASDVFMGFVLWQYAFVHQVVGWLLVPLLVASLAGIIRRQ